MSPAFVLARVDPLKSALQDSTTLSFFVICISQRREMAGMECGVEEDMCKPRN